MSLGARSGLADRESHLSESRSDSIPRSVCQCSTIPRYVLIGAPTIPSRLRAVPYLAACERESRRLAVESFRYRVGRPTFIQRMKTEESTDLMASLANALKEEISTLARREVRRQTAPADKAVARCARDIAALKREVQALEHEFASLGTPQPGPTVSPKKTSDRAPRSRRAASKVSATSTSAKPSPRSQFSGEALKAHRSLQRSSSSRARIRAAGIPCPFPVLARR